MVLIGTALMESWRCNNEYQKRRMDEPGIGEAAGGPGGALHQTCQRTGIKIIALADGTGQTRHTRKGIG